MTYTTTCYRCEGSGTINWARHVKGGVCFACNGTGIKKYARKPIEKINYAFGEADCFPRFHRKVKNDQEAANIAMKEGATIFMDHDEYNSRFASMDEASAWAATQKETT